MILTPAIPSDKNPQVHVTSENGNVSLYFWIEPSSRINRTELETELRWLLRGSTWRAGAIAGVMNTRLRRCGRGSGHSCHGCHFQLSVLRHGCTAEDFDEMFERFMTQVLQVAQL